MKTQRTHQSFIVRHGLAFTIGGIVAVLLLSIVALSVFGFFPVLDTAGPVAAAQKDLLVWTLLLMLVVVVPVFILLGVIGWRYRENATQPRAYKPDFDHSRVLEVSWWVIPFIIVAIISWFIWESSHRLDPYRPLDSTATPVNVQVVALQWKWLFIYPDEGIATVNEAVVPVGRPLAFTITSDAPMNAFWVPRLGGQVYAMSGMSTKLHLQADKAGDYKGMSGNISGEKYADMHFTVKARDENSYKTWLINTKRKSSRLSNHTYQQLHEPDTSKVLHYGQVEQGLYDKIVMKYMGHKEQEKNVDAESGDSSTHHEHH